MNGCLRLDTRRMVEPRPRRGATEDKWGNYGHRCEQRNQHLCVWHMKLLGSVHSCHWPEVDAAEVRELPPEIRTVT